MKLSAGIPDRSKSIFINYKYLVGLPCKRPIPEDQGYCGRGYYDIQGFGVKLDYCRLVGGGGCRHEKAHFSCALAGTTDQYTGIGEFEEPGDLRLMNLHTEYLSSSGFPSDIISHQHYKMFAS